MRVSAFLASLALALAPAVAAAADELLLFVDYESGSVDSAIPGLGSTNASAPDAAFIGNPGRSSQYAIGHRVVLGDPGYVSDGASRSESDTASLVATRATAGTRRFYSLSLQLSNWQDWKGGSAPVDIVWQFKHTDGDPDAFVAVKRNALVLRYGASNQATLVSDIRAYDNQWIDLKFDVLWSTQTDGFIKASVRLPGETAFQQALDASGLATFRATPAGSFVYLKWGLYRPDSVAGTDTAERVVLHDNIRVAKPLVSGELIFENGFDSL